MKQFTYKNKHCELVFKPEKLQGRELYSVFLDGEHAIYMSELPSYK